jgi:hypothetical protein
MYIATRKYYKSQNIKTIYYTFSDKITQPYVLEDDILYIYGTETPVPGILDKTIKAFEFIKPQLNQYDYVVRSNISTIINFNLLKKVLIQTPIDYGAGILMNLQWLHPEYGVVDQTHWNTNYASGTSIILSNNLMHRILENKDNINYDLIDDVSIGVFIKQQFPDITPVGFDDYYYSAANFNGNEQELINSFDSSRHIFYRNRCDDNRTVDVDQMHTILSVI